MPKITFIEPDGTRREVDATSGDSAMLAAIHNGVEGIIGECGGSSICATCRCYVDEAWRQRIGPPGSTEAMRRLPLHSGVASKLAIISSGALISLGVSSAR